MSKRRPAKAKPKGEAIAGDAVANSPVASVAQEPVKVNISAAKGRPMLTWVGKRPLSHVTAFPAQRIERHDALRIVGIDPENIDTHDEKMQLFRDLRSQCNEECWKDAPFINGVWTPEVGGVLVHGDNKDVLAFLLANGYRGKVNLVYIDPPWDSGADYVRHITLRGPAGGVRFLGQGYTLGEQIQYADIWANDNYLQFMYERLLLLKQLLSPNGSLWLHCDYHRSHYLRCVLDEVFGTDGFINEVIWQRTDPHNDAVSRLGWVHDTLFWYCNGDEPTYNYEIVADALSEAAIREYSLVKLDSGEIVPYDPQSFDAGRRFKLDDCTYKGSSAKRRFDWRGARPSDRRVWPYDSPEEMDEAVSRGEFYLRDPQRGAARCRVSFLENRSQLLQTIWSECGRMKGGVEYPTEKPNALLWRIIEASSNPGDLILDCFSGSGTALAVAQESGRRWIGCDINKGALQYTVKRQRAVILEQIVAARKRAADAKQGQLVDTGAKTSPLEKPCAFGFTVWRVNDYDLQIQHNEAVNLACEHIGVARTRSDSYFEGTFGKKLVKIIPFGHPLSPLDLEEMKRELDSRPDEDRNVIVVCLGMELAAKAWIDDWNRLRKGASAVNKIDVIELRTDVKYGKFLKHESATAKVKITRKKSDDDERIVIEIQDFISPTIIERLRDQAGILSPKIEDWRAMVDCVYIDTAYNGTVLNVALADVPERKSDLINGKYELLGPAAETTVAVKIVDMLGEEVLVTKAV